MARRGTADNVPLPEWRPVDPSFVHRFPRSHHLPTENHGRHARLAPTKGELIDREGPLLIVLPPPMPCFFLASVRSLTGRLDRPQQDVHSQSYCLVGCVLLRTVTSTSDGGHEDHGRVRDPGDLLCVVGRPTRHLKVVDPLS